MKLNYYPYTILLNDTFAISAGSRKTTPAVMLEVEQNGIIGYGEASLPPYLVENQESVLNFLRKVHLDAHGNVSEIDFLLNTVENTSPGNNAAKAAVDIAIHDLFGKINNLSLHQMLGIKLKNNLMTSFTIGISSLEELERKIAQASRYKILKIKLGSDRDKEIISSVREYTDKPIIVDVNQGWVDKNFAIEMINWLSEKNVLLIEQPLPRENLNDAKWLVSRSPLPVIADEALQVESDLEKIKDCYSGINVKLMKTGGIRNAYRIIRRARALNLKVMIGCMTETSCAISAASHLSPLADWIDLDGAELISNDLFEGMKIIEGELLIPDAPGIGVKKIKLG